jgi:hypothetical protein
MPALTSSTLASSRQPKPTDAKFNAEFSVLVACCSVQKTSLEEFFAPFTINLDWTKTLELAEHHGVIPLVYQALSERAGLAPAAVFEQLRTRYELNARKNLKFTAELFRILDCLEANSIPAIPLKGPVLAETVFGDLALRDFSDLDVLVHAHDVLKAKGALQSLDYSVSTPLTDAAERAYLTAGYEYTFDGPAGRNLLELQWNFAPRFYAVAFDVDELFSRAKRVRVCGREVRTLVPEDLLLTLSVHAAKHSWIRLHWLRDIAGVVDTQQLDWEVGIARARGLGIARIVGVSLLLAHRLLKVELPRPARALCESDREILSLADLVEQQLPQAAEYNVESLGYFFLMMRLRERAADRARFLWRLASTPGPGEWSAVRLPKALFPLYRAVRIFRLAGRLFVKRP